MATVEHTPPESGEDFFIDPHEPNPDSIAHYLTCLAYGPASFPDSWIPSEPKWVNPPDTALSSMGASYIIPFLPFRVPVRASRIASSSSELFKTVGENSPLEDTYQGHYEHGKVKIGWRTDWPVALTAADKKAWINRFLVMKRESQQVRPEPEEVITTVKPLSDYVGETFEGEILLANLDVGAPEEGKSKVVSLSLLPVDINEVWERDQKWNKAPSPKHWVKPTPANYGYDDDEGEGSTILTRTLFVAVEPGSGKVELDVKGAGGSSGTIQTLVGLKSHSGTMLDDVAIMNGGVAHFDFTPAHGINDGRHELCIGLDKNSNGKLDADEVVAFPQDKKFWIRAVTASDYTSNFDHVDWRETQAYFGGLGFTASVLQYFLAMDSTLDESTSKSSETVPITKIDLTHIAGSTFDPTTGNTTIDKFHLPDGSTASLVIESTLDIERSAGLRGVLDQTWNYYLSQFQQQFQANPQLTTWSSGPVIIKPTNGQIDGSANSFDIPDDLRYSIGTAGITGTMNFTIQRDPSDSTKFYLKQLDVDCVVEDLIDYDWTRGPISESRPASIVQIGWQPTARKGGRVFFVSIKVVESYGLSKLGKFNAAPGSGTTPPTGGPQ